MCTWSPAGEAFNKLTYPTSNTCFQFILSCSGNRLPLLGEQGNAASICRGKVAILMSWIKAVWIVMAALVTPSPGQRWAPCTAPAPPLRVTPAVLCHSSPSSMLLFPRSLLGCISSFWFGWGLNGDGFEGSITLLHLEPQLCRSTFHYGVDNCDFGASGHCSNAQAEDQCRIFLSCFFTASVRSCRYMPSRIFHGVLTSRDMIKCQAINRVSSMLISVFVLIIRFCRWHCVSRTFDRLLWDSYSYNEI